MFLRPPSWADDSLHASPTSSSSSSTQSPVVELVESLTNQRLYREVTITLKIGLRDARAEFSFIRVKGLRSLVKFLASAAKVDKTVELFQESQSYRELQVVPVLFEHILAAPKQKLKVDEVDPSGRPSVVTEPTSHEIGLALRVLEGCCLLDSASRHLASCHAAVQELLRILQLSAPAEQSACLDALLAILLDANINQKELERLHGLRKIAELVKSTQADVTVRLKGAEFLLLLIGQVLPADHPRPPNGFQHVEGRKSIWTSEGAQQEVVEILGRGCVAVLDDVKSSGGAVLDVDTKQTSLQSLAQRLVAL